jgi:hypothetical protein
MKIHNRKTWEKSDRRLKGFPFIQNRITKECALIGRNGELWEYSNGVYSAVFTKAYAIKKVAAALGVKGITQAGDELVVRFDESKLDIVLSFLNPFKHSKAAIKAATQFGVEKTSEIASDDLQASESLSSKENQNLNLKSPQNTGGQAEIEDEGETLDAVS